MVPTYQDGEMILKLYDQFESERMRAAKGWFAKELGVQDAVDLSVFWDKFPRGSEGFTYFVTLYGFFEMVGVLHKNGLIHPNLLFDMWYINGFYDKMYPVIADWRSHGDIHVAENFELLAIAELEWIGKHKGAAYVPNVSYAR
jgi:hypothetical protein